MPVVENFSSEGLMRRTERVDGAIGEAKELLDGMTRSTFQKVFLLISLRSLRGYVGGLDLDLQDVEWS